VSNLSSHIAASQKLAYDDLDWDLAAKVGLTDAERAALRYFSDVEGQTVHYFLEVAKLEVARDPELLTFMTLWNYEEYFHGHALGKLLDVCGTPQPAACERSAQVRTQARLKASIEDFFQRAIAKVMPRTFVALWMTWGALQEGLTTRGYEELERNAQNPVLAELCRRIAKQERRHFAYYYGQAKERLAESRMAQKIVRAIVERFFSLVGSGVKSELEMAQLIGVLFPGGRLYEVAGGLDKRMAALPGMEGLCVVTPYLEKQRNLLPEASTFAPELAVG
jgi:rubrerythrin